MSVDCQVYCGPYVECKPQVITGRTQKRGCINEHCTRYGVSTIDTYCPKCGTKIGNCSKETTTNVQDQDTIDNDLSVLIPLINEVIEGMTKLHIYVVPSCYDAEKENVRKHIGEFDTRTEFAMREINGEIVAAETNFVKELADLETLQKAYGADNVVVKWGVLNYLS